MTVAVLGMHRSGTSVATRLVSLLGPSLCRPEDLVRGHRGNPPGHWESSSLVEQNNELLTRLSASWWCPPSAASDPTDLAHIDELRTAARSVFEWAHPTGPWVWKDPRNCVLLPFWSAALEIKVPVILMLRHPLDVAESLLRRNRFSVGYGLALWERHLRSALVACDGLPLLVSSYDRLVEDPIRWCAETRDFLRMSGVDAVMPADPAAIDEFVGRSPATALRRSAARRSDPLSEPQRELLAVLDAASRPWSSFAVPDLSAETPTTEIVFDEARVAFGLDPTQPRTIDRPQDFMSSVDISLIEPGTARQPAAPAQSGRVSVVLVADGPDDDAAGPRLWPFLPSDAEVVIVARADADSGDGSDGIFAGGRGTVVRRREPLSLAARLNLGAEVAGGDVLVFAQGGFAPRRGWLPALRQALSAGDVGAVTPAIAFDEATDERVYGLRPADDVLNLDWITEAPSDSPFRVPVVSLRLLATTRRVFDDIGGFDEGLVGVGSEDLELCLRLWRTGYRCLAVPRAVVSCEFASSPDEWSLEARLRNVLRVGLVHLSGPDQAGLLAQLASVPELPSALAEVGAGDLGRRRAIVGAKAWYDTAWVLKSFGLDASDDPAVDADGSPDWDRT